MILFVYGLLFCTFVFFIAALDALTCAIQSKTHRIDNIKYLFAFLFLMILALSLAYGIFHKMIQCTANIGC